MKPRRAAFALATSATALLFLAGLAGVARGKPQLQFPWPPLSSAYGVSGNTYGCDTHVAHGSGAGPYYWEYNAIDFAHSDGQAVSAVADGIVNERHPNNDGFGYYIVVDHGGYFSMYAHLQSFVGSPAVGQRVVSGEAIAPSGHTGGVAPHLHMQLGRGSIASSVVAATPEPMTGKQGSTLVGITNFGQWGWGLGHCSQFHSSPTWVSAHPLNDVFFYRFTGDNHSYLSDGTGQLTLAPQTTFTGGFTVLPGQFNEDRVTDLFLYNGAGGTAYVEFGVGNGTFSFGGSGYFSAGWEPHTGDFNGDGLTDLFLYNPATPTTTYVEFANGTGGWNAVAGGTMSAGWSVFTGLFNSDNLTDLFLYNASAVQTAWVELANGAGGWTAVQSAGPLSPGWTVVPGFYNDDRWTDLFLYNSTTGGITWIEQATGAGGWTAHSNPTQPFSSGWTVDAGQFNGNPTSDTAGLKRTDLVLYRPTTGEWVVDLSTGSWTWTSGGTGNFGVTGQDVRPVFLNGDALSDLVVSSTTARTYLRTSGFSFVDNVSLGAEGYDPFPGHYDWK